MFLVWSTLKLTLLWYVNTGWNCVATNESSLPSSRQKRKGNMMVTSIVLIWLYWQLFWNKFRIRSASLPGNGCAKQKNLFYCCAPHISISDNDCHEIRVWHNMSNVFLVHFNARQRFQISKFMSIFRLMCILFTKQQWIQ